MNLAVVGCGYVAEFYGKTLGNHPQLRLIGAFDIDREHQSRFCARWPGRAYESFEDLLDDPTVDLVLNLTNPRSHYEITRRCIEAGKHVYSEKPLAMTAVQAAALVELAKGRGVMLASAPCSMLSQTAQTLWKAVRDGSVGRVRLVYANFDDGMIAPRLRPWTWRNESGVPWPAKDEFEVGCTYEHAGYVLTWLAALFGPAKRVSSFAACLIPDKGIATVGMAPDFTAGCLEYDGGVVARVTCSLVAPHDRSLTVIGDEGELLVRNVRNDVEPVWLYSTKPDLIERGTNRLRRMLRFPGWREPWRRPRRYPAVGGSPENFVGPGKPVDFCLGLADMADAFATGRPCRLSGDFGAHITELVERLQHPERFADSDVRSAFAPIQPRA